MVICRWTLGSFGVLADQRIKTESTHNAGPTVGLAFLVSTPPRSASHLWRANPVGLQVAMAMRGLLRFAFAKPRNDGNFCSSLTVTLTLTHTLLLLHRPHHISNKIIEAEIRSLGESQSHYNQVFGWYDEYDLSVEAIGIVCIDGYVGKAAVIGITR